MAPITLAVAATAGLASFFSPCMLPVVPAFLAQLGGQSRDTEGPRRLWPHAGLFVTGFVLVFVGLGLGLASLVVGAAATTVAWLSRVAGLVIIGFGLRTQTRAFAWLHRVVGVVLLGVGVLVFTQRLYVLTTLPLPGGPL